MERPGTQNKQPWQDLFEGNWDEVWKDLFPALIILGVVVVVFAIGLIKRVVEDRRDNRRKLAEIEEDRKRRFESIRRKFRQGD